MTHIHHAAINCKDLEAAKNFFHTYFNAAAGEQYHNPRTGLRSYMMTFDGGGAQLELMSWGDMEEMDYMAHRQGLTHLSLSLGNREQVNSLTERLRTDGYQIMSEPRVTGDGYYESCILGPEHVAIELTE